MNNGYGQLMQMDIYSYEDIIRKFKILEENKANAYVIDYVNSLIENINIEIFGRNIDRAMNLIQGRQLEGYCWQTTSMLVPFFNDTDYVSRGDLVFSNNLPKYYHSWINFSLSGQDYVFEPSLSLLCLRESYCEVFDVEVKHCVSSLEIREKLLYYLNSTLKDYVEIIGTDKIDDPFYRVNAKVRARVKDNKILSMDVKY